MNKREAVLGLLEGRAPYTPAAFFLHFDPAHQRGQAAVAKHLEYFRYTGMDFVKIQYEQVFPARPEIVRPGDWAGMPRYGEDFYRDPWQIARGLVQAAGKEALVLMTLYSPFMCAGHTAGKERLAAHLCEDPEAVKRGMEIITDSLLTFVRGCMAAGVDGFYHSTQGGESDRFEGSPIFEDCIKPYDLALMQESESTCIFNILHICDYVGGYRDLTPFLDYPGHVVNCSLQLGERTISGKDVAERFGRPFMGGMDRHGVIATGSQAEVAAAAQAVLEAAPERFILGADCTVPGDTDWDHLKTAIEAAHARPM